MNRRESNHRPGHVSPRWLAMLAVALSTLFPYSRMVASNAPEDAWRYTVMLNGIKQMTLDMPVYDEDGYDSWIDKGYVYITCDGKKETLFYYKSWGKSGSHPSAKFYKGVDGTMLLKRDRDYSTINVTTSEKEATIPIISGTDYAIIHLVWTIPNSYRGKTVTISWNIHKTGNGPIGPAGESSKDIGISSSEWQIPSAPDLVTPEVMDPILSYDANHIGTMMAFYTIATNNVKRVTGFWKEMNGNIYNDKSLELGTSMSGFVYLPADKCIKDFYIQATYRDSEDAEQTVESERIDLPTLHQPQSVGAQLQEDGKVVISWKINHTSWDDISPNDVWEVQRNTSERPDASSSYWRTLDMVSFSQGIEEYSYTDESLLSDYKGNNIYYRIRRAGTSAWNWSASSGYAMTMLPATLILPYFSSASVERAGKWDETQHNVSLQFVMGGQYANTMEVKSVNFAPGIMGASATSADYELPVDQQGRIILRNAADWEALVTLVKDKKGEWVNVIMANDINLGNSHSMLGTSSSSYFRGTFDGNGHTLTVNYDNVAVEGAAPFTFVREATIKNLHMAGLIRSTKKFAGGLVGRTASSTVTTLRIENCRVSATVASTIDGDASNGGFIGYAECNFNITDCLFDGQLQGSLSHSTGGFVGAFKNGCKGEFTNCLFAPTEIGTKINDCRTFIREAKVEDVTFENCYYTVPYDGRKYDDQGRFVIYNSDDWEAFAERVDNAASSGVDAILAADITITRSVGTTKGFYCGTFYGNGHTLTVNITGGEFAAPFSMIKNATIRDLNVKGTVIGGRHSSGLVGSCVSTGSENHIENCHVSTNVITSDFYAGGIIGHGHSVKNYIRNCLFDGSITAQIFNVTSYAGSFMGWEDGGTSNVVNNNLENGTYNSFNHAGLNYKYGGSAWGGSNNWHFKDWSEGNQAGSLSTDNLVSKLGSANWLASGNIALPKQTVSQVGQGFNGIDYSVAALDSLLGNGWLQMGNLVVPVMATSTEAEHQSIVWDDRAKVVVNIDKKVDNEVRYQEQHTMTQDEMLKQQMQLNLSTACVDHDFRLKVDKGESKLPLFSNDVQGFNVKKKEVGELARYEFNNNVQMAGAEADTLQQGVSLTWTIASGVADYYRILRTDKMQPDKVDTLVTDYVQTAYLDQTAKVQHNYIYTIEGVTQCEGDHISIATTEGCRIPTGTVRGYVRLSNGTGLPDVEVTATPDNGILGGVTKTARTDESGFFEISGLIYQGKGKYDLSTNGIGRDQSVFFDEDYNLFTDITFYEDTYYTFSGFVLYEGSSIPVGGVKFLRDGQPVVNSSGNEVTTNPQGAFEISVPAGSHRIQVVKEGHVFENDGYYIDLDKLEGDQRDHNWQKDLAGIYLWDKTKVYLQGRVVGGNDQGNLPLGESLSKNNLGEDVTIVMQLEGDNTSWLIRDQLDATVTERTTKYSHGMGGKDSTEVFVSRHRLVIHPDKATGEYRIPLYPVKYKVTEIYAKGYSTLFQTGMVSETVNLTDLADGETGTYSRIYHTTPTLKVKQAQNLMNDNYFGIKEYTTKDNAGNSIKINLWNDGNYSLGYPVFMSGVQVALWMEACEEYYWNNNIGDRKDIVRLNGGKVIANNELVSTDTTDDIELNKDGCASYIFSPMNATFTLEGRMALRSLKFTLEYDGSYYDITPIEGYIMAANSVPQGRRIVAGENAHLVDILRDPPGSGSSAYIEEGSKLSYNYTASIKSLLGPKINIGMGKGSNYYTGIWFGEGHGDEVGSLHSSTNYGTLTLNLVAGYYNDWTYNYEIVTNERIKTSSDSYKRGSKIGANSDLYIGFADNIIVEDGIAIYPVDSKMLSYLTPRENHTVKVNDHDFNVRGTVKILARGYDEEKKDSVYLIRDEVMKVSSSPKASFVYSQDYILTDLLPTLLRSRASLLNPLNTKDSAQELADQTKETVYVSNVADDDPNFGFDYQVFRPKDSSDQTDKVKELNNRIKQWAGFVAANEKEKMDANKLLKRYDFDGKANITYSESFSADRTEHRYIQIPNISISGTGYSKSNQGGSAGYTYDNPQAEDDDPQMNGVEFNVGGVYFTLNIQPVMQVDFNYNNGQKEIRTKSTGFTLQCPQRSNLNVAVYYTEELSNDSISKLVLLGKVGTYYNFTKETMENIYSPTLGPDNQLTWLTNDKRTRYRNFVFRTEGGATQSPWEDERRTVFYNPGSILDQKTLQVDKLRIWAKEQSVANVPYGEPARFTIYMTNESEVPDFVTKTLKIYAVDDMNPKGARILVNGAPLTGTGMDLWMEPNTIIEKQVEIYAAEEYDYEDIGITIIDDDDQDSGKTVALSAHFVPSAGKINISSPGDKWVMNTDSYYDKDRQAYAMPVHIDGFDVNFRNFDHIELQYKLSTQGDKEWVNVCSFYRNNEEGKRLMAQASGERRLMQNDGFIDVDFYGETDPIEQQYDIRAVAFCRHGNGYLTSSSNVLTGIKDTRRPVPFGTPQPVNGILGIGDDIKIAFSEPIAGNYLSSVNNFEVLGTTNQSSISLSTVMRFNGNGIAQTMSKRNLANKDFTLDLMIHPDPNGKAMTVMSHNNEGHYLALGITADRRLLAYVDGNEMTSSRSVDLSELRQVAYIFDVDEEKNSTNVSFYDGEDIIGTSSFKGMYGGNAWLNFGIDSQQNYTDNEPEHPEYNNYEGEMLEVRLWNKAMSKGELQTYAGKRLTGYELGLLDNYPMNEGNGQYAYDKGIGSNDLEMRGDATWKVPGGISLKLDGVKGVKLNERLFKREKYEDYTLMFWFRTDNMLDGTLIANGEAKDEYDYKNHFNIGFEDGTLFFRFGGQQINLQNGHYYDGAWHHTAVTINRTRNVGNIYVDQKLKQTFPIDTIGGIDGNNLYLGATYTDAHTPTKLIKGNIDELAMYEMALPENILKNYANLTPTGEEMGTLLYLPFSRSEVQTDNSQRLMPTGISLKRYKDNHGNIVETRRDTIVVQDVIEACADRGKYAPMRNIGKLENIKFSYVADGKDLLINLDVPDYQIEKTNVFITVKEVTDLQGNMMASPIVMDLYAYRNPLRWKVKRTSVEAMYGEGATVEVAIENLSGKSLDYTLEGLPIWITASQTSGKISALDEENVTFTISPYINVGEYEEVVYIVGDNGITEPLPINIHIRGEEPEWAVDDKLKEGNMTMHIVARVVVDGEISHDTEDMLVAVGEGHRIMGTAHIDVDYNNEALAYLTVYGDASTKGSMPLRFELYDASTGRIRVVEKQDSAFQEIGFMPDTIYFQNDVVLGSTTNPIILYTGWKEVQSVKLQKGWNWLSFYLMPMQATVSQLLDGAATWEVGDGLELIDANGVPHLLTYKSVYDRSTYTYRYYWDSGDKAIELNPQLMYRFYVQSDKTAYLTGETCFSGINLHKGWNRIGYLCTMNLPIATALSDYTDDASEGDIIKSQNEFAVLNIDAQGNRQWKGTLKFMKAGEGYMLRRKAQNEVNFFYPLYFNSSKYNMAPKKEAPLFRNTSGSSMNVIARVEGFDLQEGDRLVAYGGCEARGMVEASEDGIFFLSIAKGEDKTIGFAIEREGEIVATAPMQLPYIDDDVKGTLDEPTAIRFISLDSLDSDGWYTLSGIRLQSKPQQRGVYIHNGSKVTVR